MSKKPQQNNEKPEEQQHEGVSEEALKKTVEDIADKFNNGSGKKHAKDSAELAELEAKYEQETASLKDRILRLNAEMENLRRRHDKERAEAQAEGIKRFAGDMANVLDNLFRAAESITEEAAAENEQIANLKTGVDLTQKEMVNALERYGVKRIYPEGELFNHDFHQAISQVADAEKPAGTIIQVVQAGYTLKDRLLRPALVVVTTAA